MANKCCMARWARLDTLYLIAGPAVSSSAVAFDAAADTPICIWHHIDNRAHISKGRKLRIFGRTKTLRRVLAWVRAYNSASVEDTAAVGARADYKYPWYSIICLLKESGSK